MGSGRRITDCIRRFPDGTNGIPTGGKPADPSPIQSFMDTNLQSAAIEAVRKSTRKNTPRDLERLVAAACGVSAKTARRAIRKLILQNQLTYTHFMGHTFIEASFRKPVTVGEGIILVPPGISCQAPPGGIRVRIAPGAAFGIGDHPTTRIALQLTRWAILEKKCIERPAAATALDIGCGSGVLAIAACLMGINTALGIDIDACARMEALENARLNGVQDRLRTSGETVDTLEGPFSLILANLRSPFLASLSKKIREISPPGTILVFSGFREEERPGLLATYPQNQFRHLRTLSENTWCGMVLQTARI